MSKTGKLILFPNFIHGEQGVEIFSEKMKQALSTIEGCIVESEKAARALLKHFEYQHVSSFRELPLYVMTNDKEEIQKIIDIIKSGKNIGLLSDAGLPCIADPGAQIVFRAKRQGVKIEAIDVHSSIMRALMVSGLAQQAFYFVGYLPKEEKHIEEKLKRLEKLSRSEQTTIIFIETPYKNNSTLSHCLKYLSKDVFLAYCQHLGGDDEHVYIDTIANFKPEMAKVQKMPATFVFRA